MADAINKNSFVAFGQQTAFGTPQTTLVTAAYLPSSGEIFSPGQPVKLTDGTASVMQRADQTYNEIATTDFNLRFLMRSSPSWKQLFLACFGKRTDASFVRTYVVNDPPVDGGTDGTPASTFYNHALTIRHTLHDGANEVKTYVSQDCCVNRFQLFFEANKPVEFGVSGTGQAFGASTMPSFTELTGSLFTHQHGGKSANAGLYISATNPPALNGADWLPLKKVTLTLDNNLLYDVFMGTVAGQELQLPPRNNYPTATLDIEGRFSGGVSYVDAVDLMADFLAKTNKNIKIRFWIGATDIIELNATGTVAPGIIDAPKITPQGNGVMSFTAHYMIAPAVITDFSFVVTNAS